MWRGLEIACFWSSAFALLLFSWLYVAPQIHASQAVAEFKTEQTIVLPTEPDTSLWSQSRIEAYAEVPDSRAPIGLISIDRIDLQAPIYPGVQEPSLDRGVGWIESTSPLTGANNTGLAAHRDGFFRALKDIEVGDRVEVTSTETRKSYRVTGTTIVDPDETFVLERTSTDTLTLVTCYPFYFVGDAPQRFIVFATLMSDGQ